MLTAIVLGFGTFIFILKILKARSRWKAISKWQTPSTDPRLPLQDADMPNIIILPGSANVGDWLVAGSQYLHARAQRKASRWYRQTRDDDEADLHAQEALAHAAYTRGLQYLPPRYAHQLHLRIAREWLIAKEAKEALPEIDERIRDLGHDVLIEALFNPHTLAALEVGRKADAPESTYFTRFFQPLMVAFAEDTFRNSAGVRPDGHVVLLNHMKNVSNKRVKALYLVLNNIPCTAVELCQVLPQPLPSAYKPQEKGATKIFNRKESAHALVVVAQPSEVQVAELYSIRVDEHLSKAPGKFMALTQDEADAAAGMVFLWQKESEADGQS